MYQLQEILVIDYLVIMMRNVESLSEARVMPIIRERQIFLLLVRFLLTHHTHLEPSLCLTTIHALALICETEHFATYKNDYINGKEDVEMLLALRRDCLSTYQTDFQRRKLMKPLNDYIDLLRRKFHLK